MTASLFETTIVDASVALKWVIEEEGSDRAIALLDGRGLAAPDFWLVEAANALWRRQHKGELTPQEAAARLEQLHGAPVYPLDTKDLLWAAWDIANHIDHPIYDCLYLAAALKTRGMVVTADRRLLEAGSKSPMISQEMLTLL